MIEYHQEPGYISHWNLLIKHVTKEHAGVYECQITAKHKLVRFVTLVVTGRTRHFLLICQAGAGGGVWGGELADG